MIRSIKLHVPKNVRALQPTGVETYRAAISVALKELLPRAKALAQVETPVGATGDLVKNILTSTTATTAKLEWISSHAMSVQYGSKAHWAPIAPLRLWVQKVLGSSNRDLPYKLQALIAKKGTKPQKFLQRARAKVSEYVIPAFKQRMALLAKILSGDLGP